MILQTKIYKTDKQVEEYLKTHDPYRTVPLGYDIQAMYRYAKEHGKKIADLTQAEADRFRTNEAQYV